MQYRYRRLLDLNHPHAVAQEIFTDAAVDPRLLRGAYPAELSVSTSSTASSGPSIRSHAAPTIVSVSMP